MLSLVVALHLHLHQHKIKVVSKEGEMGEQQQEEEGENVIHMGIMIVVHRMNEELRVDRGNKIKYM